MDTLKIKRLSQDATLPTRTTALAAGYDLCCVEDITLQPGQRILAKTDLAMIIPQGTYARMAPRSGLANKYGLDVLAGVVDAVRQTISNIFCFKTRTI